MKRFICLLICTIALCALASSANSKFVVVIDAGHGGKDGGAVRGSYKEKDINLGVAKALGELIEANFDDVKVIYTRSTDVFVDLDKRTEIANKAKANLFISIHTNSTASKLTDASGADTYILGLARSAENLEVAKRENSVILMEDNYTSKYEGFDPNSPESYIIFEFMSNKFMEQSLQFAELVQKDIKGIARRSDRGVRQAGFLVLRKSSMPSVLVELGFINNPTEAKFLSSRLGQRTMATAIYSGFKKFKRDFDKKQGKTTSIQKDAVEEEVFVIDDEVTVEDENIDVEAISAEEKIIKKDNVVDNSAKPSAKEPAKPVATVQDKPSVKEQSRVSEIPANQIEYRVQFLVSSQKLNDNAAILKGLSPVKYTKDGNSFKYTYGSTTDLNEIIKIQKQIRAKFSDAFVVKFKNGERVK